jgi:hypothetical protein
MAAGADRAARIAGFLAAHGWAGTAPSPLAGDASFRRYYRLADGARRAVLMDAPPPEQEKLPAYVAVAEALRRFGLSAPEVYAEDHDCGLLLIEDFGDETFTRALAGGADETGLYALAIDTLIALQRAVTASGLPDLPVYDEARLLTEASLLVDWYIPAALGRGLPDAARAEYLELWREALQLAAPEAPTLVLRDYHVDNLMRLPGRPGVSGCGILDFQDAVIGSPAYDLISLLEDARRDVPPALRTEMTERYLAAFPDIDRAVFHRAAAILAAQRNAKIVGLFVRLWQRDGKPAYLAHLPRVWRLLEADLAEPALAPLVRWLDRHLPARLRQLPQALRMSAA